MKLWFGVKNFFSYLAFFNSERQLRHYQQTFQHRESSYRHQIDNKERLIQELRDKIIALEFEKHESNEEIKKRFLEMNHLQKQLQQAKQESIDTQSKLSALHLTHLHLVNHFNNHLKKNHAAIPHHH